MLTYAEKLTLEPGSVRREDVDALREAGLGDEGILHLTEVVSYFNFVNRMADGLGVRLEEAWREDPPIGGPGEPPGDGPGPGDEGTGRR